VYVGDVVDAVLRAAGHGGVFNVGTGVETSVLELYDATRHATGIEREAQFAEPRLGELQRSVLDPAAAARELGWRPEVELEQGLRETWDWIASR
jgi:UDP-glucose 4-epimerase